MGSIYNFISAAFVAMIVENIVFSRALGISTLISISKNKGQIFGFSVCITYMSAISCMIAFFVNKIFSKIEFSHIFMPIIYLLLISCVYIITLLAMWKWFYKTFVSMKKYVHLSTFNYAVFGALLLSARSCTTFLEFLGFGIGSGLGFAIATFFLSVSYVKLHSHKVPSAFRGFPLVLIYMGILSMAFYGLIGHKLSL